MNRIKRINEITMPHSDGAGQIIDMSHRFPNDKDSKVNLSDFVSTSQAMNMSHMFPNDKDSKADLFSFTNTSQVMDMSHMFVNYPDAELENKGD